MLHIIIEKIIVLGYEMKAYLIIIIMFSFCFTSFLLIMTRLNQLQLKFLEELRMIEIMKALQTFVIWLQEGMYDFSSLSVTLKEDLRDCHIQKLKQATAVAVSEGTDIIANDAVSTSIYIVTYTCIYIIHIIYYIFCLPSFKYIT